MCLFITARINPPSWTFNSTIVNYQLRGLFHVSNFTEPLSLVNGKTYGAGRVTVYDNLKKEHAPLCGDGLDQVDADIICKQIVRQGARSFTFQPLDGSSSQHVAFSEPECKGDEASIQSCLHAPWYSKTTKCSKTVDVACIGTDAIFDHLHFE